MAAETTQDHLFPKVRSEPNLPARVSTTNAGVLDTDHPAGRMELRVQFY